MTRLAILLLCLVISSCCPKITESTSTVTHTDTIREYHSQIVTVHDAIERITGIDVDSLLAILNGPAVEHPDSVLSKSSTKGVTTKLVRRGNKILCETTIDSLQAQVDSLETLLVNKNTTSVVTKVVYKCQNKWHRFYRRCFFGMLLLLVILISWHGGRKALKLW